MSKLTILIPDRLEPPAHVEQAVFGDGADIILPQATNAKNISDDVWAGCDAILAWHDLYYDAKLLKKMTKCKIIVRVGMGFDNVDIEAAKECGIAVCNVPDYGTNDVADHTLGLMVSLARGIPLYNNAAKAGKWCWETGSALFRLTGATLGIVGLGRIGTATALRAKAFGLNVRFYDPYLPSGVDKVLGVVRDESLAGLASESNIVTVHTPLTDETNGLIDEDFFGYCKDGVVFINTARGPIVNFDALYESMQTNKVMAAGLDVLPVEPPDWSHPLIAAWKNNEPWLQGRLVITPHSAFYNKQSYKEMRKKAAEEALRFLRGEKARNRIV